MFSRIRQKLESLDAVERLTVVVPDDLAELSETTRREYEESKTVLDELKKEVTRYEELLSIVERDRVKLMSELALKMQYKHDLHRKVTERKTEQSSMEFDMKKYNKMKISTADLESFTFVKNKFLTYKNMLKIHFDYSNCLGSTTQKGYMYNRITKNLTYFEFKKDENTADEISDYLWNKMKMVCDKNWNTLLDQ